MILSHVVFCQGQNFALSQLHQHQHGGGQNAAVDPIDAAHQLFIKRKVDSCCHSDHYLKYYEVRLFYNSSHYVYNGLNSYCLLYTSPSPRD